MIVEHNYDKYRGNFKLTVPRSENNTEGPSISLQVYPLCHSQNRHLSVHLKVEVPTKFDASVSNVYHRNLRVLIVPCHQQGDPIAKMSLVDIPLTPGQNEFESTLKEVVPHDKIIYNESSIIKLAVTAMLSLHEKTTDIVESETDDTVFLSLITHSTNTEQD